MNSYPVHFVAHPRPLLFVAGLDPAPGAAAPSSSSSLPSDAPVSQQPASESLNADDAVFSLLAQQLRELLGKQAGLNAWEPTAAAAAEGSGASEHGGDGTQGQAERRGFRVVLVDKDVRFPPSKVLPSASPSHPGAPSHGSTPSISTGLRSPLSPLTPGSPAYPDGLIAPVWIRKHADLLPSNFVLFHRLAPSTSPLAGGEDDELIADLACRRKAMSERGVKLTVVLLASRELLDSPTLDSRLSHLRRSATLDARSSLFVLTPVSEDELVEFSRSLQDVLWESALEYYSAKEKRAQRRRKARGGDGRQGAGKALGVEGWRVRDEFKAGFWAEMKGEWEPASKHYHASYTSLIALLASPALPARTKRWAEAKVLSDALVLRLSRLALYARRPSLVAPLVRGHVAALARLGEGWGMDSHGWEWASWEGRQYRLLGELLEKAGEDVAALLGPKDGQAPAEVLLGREWWFFEAGRCAEQREVTFREELEQEKAEGPGAGGEERAGWANEKKVDHLQLIVELFTKSYTILSASPAPHTRLALHVAHRLALAYTRAGKADLARRFWERLGRGYEREGWGAGLLGDEVMLERGLGAEGVESQWEALVDRRITQSDFLEYLQANTPSSMEPTIIPAAATSHALSCYSAFYLPQVYAGAAVPWQVQVHTIVDLSDFAFGELRIQLSDERTVQVTHEAGEGGLSVAKVGEGFKGTARLVFEQGEDGVVISGWTKSEESGSLSVIDVILLLKVNDWTLEIHLDPNSSLTRGQQHVPRWLASVDPPSFVALQGTEPHLTHIIPRPHLIEVDISHPSPAYLEEDYPISLSVSNRDTRSLDVWLDVLVHPSEEHDHNCITLDKQSSSSLISKVFLGTVAPSEDISRTLILRAEGTSGDRTLDFSVQTRLAIATPGHQRTASDASAEGVKPEEHTRTLSVTCIRPLSVAFDLKQYAPLGPKRELLDLEEDNGFEKTEEVLVAARFELLGPTAVVVESITFHEEAVPYARSTFSSLSSRSTEQPTTWRQGHSFSAICGFDLDTTTTDGEVEDDDLSLALRHLSPGWYDVAWRRTSDKMQSTISHSRFNLPSLLQVSSALDRPSERLTALLEPSSSRFTLMEPFELDLTIHNDSPSRSAAVQIQVDSSDSFAWTGPRSARLPLLLAGSSRVVRLRAVPLRVGRVRLPRIRLWEVLSVEGGEQGETQLREFAVRMEGGAERGPGQDDGVGSSLQVFVIPS